MAASTVLSHWANWSESQRVEIMQRIVNCMKNGAINTRTPVHCPCCQAMCEITPWEVLVADNYLCVRCQKSKALVMFDFIGDVLGDKVWMTAGC